MHVARRSMVALCVISCVAVSACGEGERETSDTSAESSLLAIRTAVAEGRQEPVTLTLDGTLVADEESLVTSVVAGRVVEVLVERGSVVEEGQPLVRLRDVDYRLQARAARAQLEQARARLGMAEGNEAPRAEDMPDVRAALSALELAESNLERAEELARRGVLSAQALDETRTRAAQAREQYQTTLNGARATIASLEAARTTLSQAHTSASEATVRAPFEGEIASRNVSVGEYVSPQTPIVSLVRTDPLRIEVEVPQQHLMAVRPGQTVWIRVDAIAEQTFEGTIRYVSAAVQRETRGLTVEAVVPNPERMLRPGLFATARIDTGQLRDVAVIPSSAVMSEAGVDRVFIVSEGVVEERVVSVAERGPQEVVIAEGVVPGEVVATEALDRLADGLRVEPRHESPAPAPTEPTLERN